MQIIQKDTNVMVIALAGKCLAQLANGLKKRFHIYASACISALLEKFKEKKQNVVVAMREAIDAVYLSVSYLIVLFLPQYKCITVCITKLYLTVICNVLFIMKRLHFSKKTSITDKH